MALSISRNKALENTGKQKKVKSSPQGRFVLFVGDEGAILTYTHKTKVQRRIFAASPAPEHVEQMRALLSADRAAPIYLLLDSMDQAYQRQTLPPVAKVSLGKIIQRRLDRDFAPEDIKGALEIGREKGGRRDWNYLLVAVSTSGAVPAWLELLLDRPNPFMGIYLSPVESEGLIGRLAASVHAPIPDVIEAEPQSEDAGKKKPKAKGKKKISGSSYQWQLLVSHHKVGGFRLVVLNEGKLAFTRMAQPVGDTSPEVVAGNVEQEAINTIEYMKRMGYQDGMPLQVFILVSSEIKASIATRNIPAQAHHFFTPFEAATALGLDQVAQEEDHYADVLQSVHMLTVRSHRLVMHNAQTKVMRSLAHAASGVRALGLLAAIGLAAFGLWQAMQGLGMGEALDKLEREQRERQEEFNKAEAVMKQFPGDVKQMLDVLRLYRAHNTDVKQFAASAYAKLDSIPRDALALNNSQWSRTVVSGQYGGPATEKMDMTLAGVISKDYSDTLQVLKNRLETVRGNVAKSFPDADVTYGPLPEIFTDTGELKTTIGGAAQDDAFQKMMSEPLKVELRIRVPKAGAAQ